MIKQISYTKRRKLFPWGLIIVCLLVYWLSFSKTLAIASYTHSLKEKSRSMNEAPQKIASLQQKLKDLEKVSIGDPKGGYQQRLLEIVSSYSSKHGLLLKQFPINTIEEQNTFKISTNYFKVEGDFINTMGLVSLLEKSGVKGSISSISSELKTDNKTKNTFLETTVYIQNLVK